MHSARQTKSVVMSTRANVASSIQLKIANSHGRRCRTKIVDKATKVKGATNG